MSSLVRIDRREFLRRTGYASGGLAFALNLGACAPKDGGALPVAIAGESVAANVYVNVRDDGIVEIVCHRSEMGQGIRTSLPQVIADEMEADWDKIEVIQAIGHERYGDQNTDGSTSIRRHFDTLRNAGATARDMMRAAAAKTWGVPVEECIARQHAIHHEASRRSAGFGELVAVAADIPQPESAAFKNKSDYRYIGKAIDTIDGHAFTTGTANYGIDTVLPDMLYASIERCPAFGGKLLSYDEAGALKVAGVVAVIRMPEPTAPAVFNIQGGVAVLASNTWSAEQGRKALNPQWDLGENGEYSSDTYKRSLEDSIAQAGKTVRERGDVDGDSSASHEAVYYAPHLSQAPMEPPAATAQVNSDGSCEVWACTQHPQSARDTLASTLGIEKEQVTVNVTLLGGGFGRKSKSDFIAEAAWLARETAKPVKVTWTREDDLRHGYLHAVSAQYFRAGLDANGAVDSWLHRTAFPSISASFAPDVVNGSAGELGLGATDVAWDIKNLRVESCKAKAHLRIGWMRSVCNVFHAFGVSSFADELAHVRKLDPLQNLLEMIGPARKIDPNKEGAEYSNYGQSLDEHPIDTGRLAAVAKKAAALANWGRDLSPGRGLGIAVHRSFLAYVAAVAEVSVDAQGKITVEEMWTCIDAGIVVNTDRVRSQMEGAAIFGMSLALHSEITTTNGAVDQGNFDTYRLIRMNEAPAAVHCHIMESDAPPGGVGEPGVPPIAPAIANAYFAATGKRVRELPLSKVGAA